MPEFVVFAAPAHNISNEMRAAVKSTRDEAETVKKEMEARYPKWSFRVGECA